MKTSTYDEPEDDSVLDSMTSYESFEAQSIPHIAQSNSEPPPVPSRIIKYTETVATPLSSLESAGDNAETTTRDTELGSPEEVIFHKVKIYSYNAERWSDTSVSLPGQAEDVETVTSDTDLANAQCEPISEMYYTASSEVSLISDTEVADRDNEMSLQNEGKDDRKNVIAGHVAAMRERFESMTRTNTPCPDLARSLSPSLEVFRNTSPSPDRLAK